MEKEEGILRIMEEVESCRKCGLWKTRKNPVSGEGSLHPKVMLIGEAPGFNEDQQGKPFVGRGGGVLDELLGLIGLERGEVYITNILKCRPPGNRDPLPEEIRKCTPYLDRQISLIKPKIIVTLGNFATSYILEKFGLEPENIGKIHGKVFTISNLMLTARIIPVYHPAVVLRNPELRGSLVEDFKILEDVMRRAAEP
jgi:uracil-DNA glycosylase family 4